MMGFHIPNPPFMDLLDKLNWRYATKIFDTTKKVPAEQFEMLLESLRLAPSSFGLQPWKFVVVENPEVRAQLREAAWGQAQVTDASHFIVLCRTEKIGEAEIQHFVDTTAAARGVEASTMDAYKQMMLGTVGGMSEERKALWASEQVYLALGMMLTVAAANEIDAAPMEGFDSAKFDEILGLPEKGLRSVVVCAIGYRSADDKYAEAKKVRYPLTDLVIRL